MRRWLPLFLILAGCGDGEPEHPPVPVNTEHEQRLLAVATRAPWRVEDETWAPPSTPSPGRLMSAAPFSPRAAPDHVVVMDSMGPGPGERRTVRRHGDWVLVDDMHVSLTRPLLVRYKRAPGGGYSEIFLSAEDGAGLLPNNARATGERRTIAGETCAVWKLGDSRGSCLTRDGIELWRTDGHVTHSAVSVRREPVPAALTTPPNDLLDPSLWPLSRPPADAASVEAILSSGLERSRIEGGQRYRRMGAIERFDQARSISIRDRDSGASVFFTTSPLGHYERLSLQAPQSYDMKPRLMERHAPLHVNGRACRWHNMEPHVTDSSTTVCLTRDGVPLRTTATSWGSTIRELVATSVTRGRLSPEDVALPPAVLAPESWGLPSSP